MTDKEEMDETFNFLTTYLSNDYEIGTSKKEMPKEILDKIEELRELYEPHYYKNNRFPCMRDGT